MWVQLALFYFLTIVNIYSSNIAISNTNFNTDEVYCDFKFDSSNGQKVYSVENIAAQIIQRVSVFMNGKSEGKIYEHN